MNDHKTETPSSPEVHIFKDMTPWYKKEVVVITAGATLAVLVLAGISFGAWMYFSHPKTTLTTAIDAFDKNDYNHAIVQADALLAKDPNNIYALIAKSLFLSQKGSLEFKETEYGTQALSFADKALEVDATKSEAWRARAYANEIMQKYSDAHTAYEKAIGLDDKNAQALFGNAHAYDLEGNTVKAEAGYRAAIAVDPTMVVAYAGLGRVLASQGKNADALTQFMKANDLVTNTHQQAEISHSIAMIKKAQGDLDGARTFAEEATTFDPSYPLGWYGLGSVLFKQATLTSVPIKPDDRVKFLEGSNQALNKAIALNPNQSLAYLDLASGFAFANKTSVALEILKKAEEVVPKDITLNTAQKKDVLKQIAALKTEIQKLGKKIPTT